MRALRVLFPLLFVATSAPLAAQTSEDPSRDMVEDSGNAETAPPIATDRPGNGNAATTVPQWAFQLEASASYALERVPMGDDRHWLAFPTLIRFGLLPIFELRVGSAILGVDARPPMDQRTVHPTDTSVGLKVQLLKNDGAVPALSLMTDVFLPSGRAPFTDDAVLPELRAALGWGLPAGFGLLLNAGLDVPADSAGRYARALYVVNLAYAFPFAERRLSVFVESYGLIPLGTDRDAIVQLDWGAAFRITADTQIDFYAQHGLTDAAIDFQIALGFSARFSVR